MKTVGRKEKVIEKVMRGMVLVLITVLSVIGLAFFVSGTALSQTEEAFVKDEAMLRALEKEYVSDIRGYLKEQGFEDSGVTLTWMMHEDGSRCYEVLLHHRKMDGLSQSEREALFAEVLELAFEVAGCNFQVKLLVS